MGIEGFWFDLCRAASVWFFQSVSASLFDAKGNVPSGNVLLVWLKRLCYVWKGNKVGIISPRRLWRRGYIWLLILASHLKLTHNISFIKCSLLGFCGRIWISLLKDSFIFLAKKKKIHWFHSSFQQIQSGLYLLFGWKLVSQTHAWPSPEIIVGSSSHCPASSNRQVASFILAIIKKKILV
jgi:hypothetical protein